MVIRTRARSLDDGTGQGTEVPATSLASFLFHPRLVKILEWQDVIVPRRVAGNGGGGMGEDNDDDDDDGDGGGRDEEEECDIRYQCNDQLMDMVWGGVCNPSSSQGTPHSAGAGSTAGRGSPTSTFVETPNMVSMKLQPGAAPKTSNIYDLEASASAWARKRRLRVVGRRHAVVCRETLAVLLVDLILETEDCGRAGSCCSANPCKNGMVARSRPTRDCYLVSVYYSPRRGGPAAKYARQVAFR